MLKRPWQAEVLLFMTVQGLVVLRVLLAQTVKAHWAVWEVTEVVSQVEMGTYQKELVQEQVAVRHMATSDN